jgi:NADH-quinone oxidoreductase subunit G
VAIGEAFGYEPGELLTRKLYSVLRKLGFKAVFDTNFSADVTIIEEATEFVNRFTRVEHCRLSHHAALHGLILWKSISLK